MKLMAGFVATFTGASVAILGLAFGIVMIRDTAYACLAPWTMLCAAFVGACIVYCGCTVLYDA